MLSQSGRLTVWRRVPSWKVRVRLIKDLQGGKNSDEEESGWISREIVDDVV